MVGGADRVVSGGGGNRAAIQVHERGASDGAHDRVASVRRNRQRGDILTGRDGGDRASGHGIAQHHVAVGKRHHHEAPHRVGGDGPRDFSGSEPDGSNRSEARARRVGIDHEDLGGPDRDPDLPIVGRPRGVRERNRRGRKRDVREPLPVTRSRSSRDLVKVEERLASAFPCHGDHATVVRATQVLECADRGCARALLAARRQHEAGRPGSQALDRIHHPESRGERPIAVRSHHREP